MRDKIKKLYMDSFKSATVLDFHSGEQSEFDPELFADKILNHCRDIAGRYIVSTGFESYDELEESDKIAEDTAVAICGSITLLMANQHGS